MIYIDEKSWKKQRKIAVIIFLILFIIELPIFVSLYVNIKKVTITEFKDSEVKLIEKELGFELPENADIKVAQYSRSDGLIIQISNIQDMYNFLHLLDDDTINFNRNEIDAFALYLRDKTESPLLQSDKYTYLIGNKTPKLYRENNDNLFYTLSFEFMPNSSPSKKTLNKNKKFKAIIFYDSGEYIAEIEVGSVMNKDDINKIFSVFSFRK